MRKRLIASLLALAAALPAQAQEKPDLVTILTSAEPQTQLMSMVLTMQALQQGSNTHILLCGPGGDLALKEPPPAPQPRRNPRA